MKTLIRGGRVLDPANSIDAVMDVLLEDGKIKKVSENITEEADKIIDAAGLWVCPGFIDLHVHLREPGFTYKETIATGTRSAVMGGFTTVCCMPNTNPVIDSEILVEYVKLKAEREGACHVLPIGAITKGQSGEELAEIGSMANAGACALSEDGKSVLSAGLLKTAMNYAKMFNLPILSHCEDKTLAGSGSMNAGPQAQMLGLKGISNDSEEVIVARDIILAESTKTPLHICHISTAGSVELVRAAQKRGSKITCEVTPHHFTLSDKAVVDYDGNTKMNPPLRSEKDVAAVLEGLKDGTIGMIATDHAPHGVDEKNCEYEKAAFGIVGLETALPLGVSELVEGGWLSPLQLVEKMAANPAKLLGLPIGSLTEGYAADVTLVDPEKEWTVDVEAFASKSKNSPFNGRKVKGKVVYTIVSGEVVVEEGALKK